MTITLTERRLFTVSDYHKMAEAGVFLPDERVELLGGEIHPMSPTGGKHIRVVANLTKILVQELATIYDILVQSPIHLSNKSEPEPDAAVVRQYQKGEALDVPPARDVFLVIEVSDSTLPYDRDVKIHFYAEAGIPETWIIDLNKDTISQYLEPQDGLYTRYTTWRKGDVIPCHLGVDIAVSDVLV
jgi:Uma2 family endonuclease